MTIQLSKPVTFGHPGGFECGFADVDATWRWSPPVSTPLPLLSLSSLLSLTLPCSVLRQRPPARWPAMPDRQATPRTTPRPACARHRPVPSPRPRLGHARALPARRTRPCRPPRRALRPSPRALPYPALPSLTCFASTPPASLSTPLPSQSQAELLSEPRTAPLPARLTRE